MSSVSRSSPVEQAGSGIRPLTLLRVLVGLFYFPHVYSKITAFQGTVAFFSKAGFNPGEFFVVFSGLAELGFGLALVFGFFTKYAALGSAGLMAVAAYAIIAVKGLGWFWAGGGIEYLVFWGLASLIVFIDAWRQEPGLFGVGKNIRG